MDGHPIVICEECGKKYRVDTGKILGQAAGFKCRSCGHLIRVSRPRTMGSDTGHDVAARLPEPGLNLDSNPSAQAEPVGRRASRTGISLKAKALLLLLVVPAAIAAAGIWLFLDQTEEMVSVMHRETFFMRLLLLAGFILAALAVALGSGLRLAGRIRDLADMAERTVPVHSVSADDLSRIREAVARVQDLARKESA
jgi:hypothetical protein